MKKYIILLLILSSCVENKKFSTEVYVVDAVESSRDNLVWYELKGGSCIFCDNSIYVQDTVKKYNVGDTLLFKLK